MFYCSAKVVEIPCKTEQIETFAFKSQRACNINQCMKYQIGELLKIIDQKQMKTFELQWQIQSLTDKIAQEKITTAELALELKTVKSQAESCRKLF